MNDDDNKPDYAFEIMIFVAAIIMMIGPLMLATWLEYRG